MKTIIKNESAQAGVGTLIIFIAMVLVAAVAAAVLIQTSGVMQAKSTTTTKEAAAAVAENLVVEAVEGVPVAAGGSLAAINVTIRLAAGGTDVDLSKVLVKIQSTNFNYSNSTTPPAGSFNVYALRSEAGTLATGSTGLSSLLNPTLQAGALARLDIVVPGSVTLTQKKPMTIALTPEKGATYNLPLVLPAVPTYATSPTVSIYP
ncbi:MAG TPA: archaellin/type IV pilin N-terminal domain-containing protein [candidate division Zixibacteria bacterium]|nr:archaellin/type IV pilin N-terminal domain-containing protein [candidate division Zixibacteria bacterium]